MAVKRIDEYTVQHSQGDLTVTVRTSDQYCTIWCGDRPMGTLQRRRATDRGTIHHKDGNPQNNDPANLELVQTPRWTLYLTDGVKLAGANWISTLMIILSNHVSRQGA